MKRFIQIFVMILMVGGILSETAKEKKGRIQKIKEKIKKNSYKITDITDEDELKLENMCDDCENINQLKSCVLACNETASEIARKTYGSVCGEFIDLTEIVKLKKEKKAKSRKRRSSGTYGDPCTTGTPVQKILTYAFDHLDQEVELYIDYNSHVYRTFYVLECQQQSAYFPYSGWSCQPQDVLVKAAVFELDGYDIQVRNIKVPASCSLMKIV